MSESIAQLKESKLISKEELHFHIGEVAKEQQDTECMKNENHLIFNDLPESSASDIQE